MSKKNKDRRRKLTDERVERINRQRTLQDGGEPSSKFHSSASSWIQEGVLLKWNTMDGR